MVFIFCGYWTISNAHTWNLLSNLIIILLKIIKNYYSFRLLFHLYIWIMFFRYTNLFTRTLCTDISKGANPDKKKILLLLLDQKGLHTLQSKIFTNGLTKRSYIDDKHWFWRRINTFRSENGWKSSIDCGFRLKFDRRWIKNIYSTRKFLTKSK